jgi:arylsulfatase
MEPTYIMEGRRGQKSRNLKVYDLEQRRLVDREAVDRTADFMRRQVEKGRPFYAYVPLTQVHFPTLPHPDFAGVTGNGDFADSMVQTDHYVGELLDLVDELGIRDNTIFVFTSDNGPDPNWPYQGSAGPWTGYYFTHQEGSLRTPFIIRWPGKIAAGRVSNEIVHEMDTYVTLARIAGVEVPTDRAVDGVDQLAFFLGEQQQSNRDSVLAFVADRLEAVKWNDWKLELYQRQRDWWSPPVKLGTPKLFNLLADPREEYPQPSIRNSWVAHPALEHAAEFRHSLAKHPPIPTGTPDPYRP